MTDPAIQAAERYWEKVGDPDAMESMGGAIASGAADEALAPLRKFHMPYNTGFTGGPVYCTTCRGSQLVPWPCDQARLLYSDAELNPEGTTP